MEILEARMTMMEADLARLSSSNRKYRIFSFATLGLACLPFVLGGVRFDDTITARFIKVDQIAIMRNGKNFGSIGTTSGGLTHQEGAFLELRDRSGVNLVDLRANDPSGSSLTLRNSRDGKPALRLGQAGFGDAEILAANRSGQLVSQLGVDKAGNGFFSILEGNDALKPGRPLGDLKGSAKTIATIGADAEGSGTVNVNDSFGRAMVNLGVTPAPKLPLAATTRSATIRLPDQSGRLAVQNQAGTVLFKAP